IRREVWTPLPEDLLLDDVYVPMHAVLNGWRVGFVDDARAFETRQAPPTREYARKVRTLTGVIQLVVKLPGLLVPLRNPIWLQFTCHKLLRLATPYALAAVALWVAAVTVRELGAWALGGVAVVAALAAWAAQSSSV